MGLKLLKNSANLPHRQAAQIAGHTCSKMLNLSLNGVGIAFAVGCASWFCNATIIKSLNNLSI
jgi:hypothetical protein